MNSQYESFSDGIYQPASATPINNQFYQYTDTQSTFMPSSKMAQACAGAQQQQIMPQQQMLPPSALNMPQQQQMLPQIGTNGNQSITYTVPETVTNPYFWPAYLSRYIGHWVRISSFIGNSFSDYTGRLVEVGAAYVSIRPLMPETLLVIDMYSIKVVQIILTTDVNELLDGTNLQ